MALVADTRRLEALCLEQGEPLGAGQQRIGRAQIGVSEPPPAFGQPEGDVDPPLGAHPFEQQQHAPRLELLAKVGEGTPQVGCRVHDVGCEDEVESARSRIPGRGRLFEIQHLELHERMVGEALPGLRHEQRTDVGEQVRRAVGRQHRRDPRRRPAGASTHLQHPQRSINGQLGQHRPHGLAHELVADLGFGRIPIERLGELRRAAGEEELQRVGSASHHVGKARAASGDQREAGAERVHIEGAGRAVRARDPRDGHGPITSQPPGIGRSTPSSVRMSNQRASRRW